MTKNICLATSLFFLLAAFTVIAKPQEQSWTGEISDSHCRLEHEALSQGDPVLPSPDCVKLCLKSGYKYVFVAGEKLYSISNQDQPDLAKFAGQSVKLTGRLNGDVLSVSKVEKFGPVNQAALLLESDGLRRTWRRNM